MHVRGASARRSRMHVNKRILQVKNDQVAGMHAQIGRFMPLPVAIAIAHGAIRLGGVIRGKLRFEDSIHAAQIVRLWHNTSGLRPRAGIGPPGFGM